MSVDLHSYEEQLIRATVFGDYKEFTPRSAFGRGLVADYQGFQEAGFSVEHAFINTLVSNTPILSSIYSGFEIAAGKSLRGRDLGRPLTEWDYSTRIFGIVLDVGLPLAGKVLAAEMAPARMAGLRAIEEASALRAFEAAEVSSVGRVERVASTSGNLTLRSSASTGSSESVYFPRKNIPTGEVTIQELLADASRVPGSVGAYLRVQPGEVIRFSDLSQLTIHHGGAEFMLTREVLRNGNQVTRRWRIYSGTPEQIPPPRFLIPSAPGGGTRIERIVGHTHARTLPYDPIIMQPSLADLYYLNRVAGEWRQVYGPQSEPFGRIIWGLNPGETTIYGIGSTPGNAVPPSWLRIP